MSQHTGASKGKLLTALENVLADWDNPMAGASPFKRQVFTSRLTGADVQATA